MISLIIIIVQYKCRCSYSYDLSWIFWILRMKLRNVEETKKRIIVKGINQKKFARRIIWIRVIAAQWALNRNSMLTIHAMYLSSFDDSPTCSIDSVSFVSNIDKILSIQITKQVYLDRIKTIYDFSFFFNDQSKERTCLYLTNIFVDRWLCSIFFFSLLINGLKIGKQ
jgi:hypothetical protein